MSARARERQHPGSRLTRARAVLRVVVAEAGEDRVLGLAAEVAFFGVLSLFPGLLIAASLLGYLEAVVGADVAVQVRTGVVGSLDAALADRGSPVVGAVRDVFEGGYGGLLTFATIGALVSLSGAGGVLVDALNLAYDTEERRSWLHRRLLGLALGVATVVVVVLALALVVVGPLLGRGQELAEMVGQGSTFVAVWDVLRLPLLLAGVTLWLVLVFHMAPNRRTPWRSSIPGALATALMWLLASLGLHLYLRVVGGGNPLLGAFGGGAVVMIWAYLLAVAVLVGGELNAVLNDRRHTRRRTERRRTREE